MQREINIREEYWYWLLDMANLTSHSPGEMIEIYIELNKQEMMNIGEKKYGSNIHEFENDLEKPKDDKTINQQKEFQYSDENLIVNKVFIKPLWILEKDAIQEAISLYQGNIQEVARNLEISIATVYRKIEKYGIKMID